MKNILIFASVFTSAVLISGCTATDWVHAAGGIMGAKDDYDRKARTDRLKKPMLPRVASKADHTLEPGRYSMQNDGSAISFAAEFIFMR